MRVLLEAAKPVPSAELGKQLGLFTNEVGSPARWLLEQQYIERSFRKIKIEFGGRPGKSRFAFWTLTDKGMAYLTGKDVKQEPAGEPPDDQPAG